LLGSVALAGCSSASGPDRSEDPVAQAQSPIAYGTADTAHTAVVGVLANAGGGSYSACSGTVVQVKNGQGYVLTAAHCCNMGSPTIVVMANDYSVGEPYLGGGNPAPPVFKVVAGSVFYDTQYDGQDHDFCMLKFSGATASTPVIPVALPGQDGLVLGVMVEHVGFGITDNNQNNSSRRTGTEKLDQNLTGLILQWSQGGGSHIPGPCEGDSGGPALIPAGAPQGSQKVVGTTSYGDSASCSGATLGVASRVTSETGATGFITNFLNDAPTGTPGGTAVPNCGLQSADANCNTCLDTSCCSQGAACAADSTCIACLGASPPTSCGSDAAYNALIQCLKASCAAPCGISSGSSSSSSSGATTGAGTTTGAGAGTTTGGATTGGAGGAGGAGGSDASGSGAGHHYVTVQESACSAGAPGADPSGTAGIAGLLLGAAIASSRRRRSA
jgi:hypothetical protein